MAKTHDGNPTGPLWIGVTLSDGDANGSFIYPDSFVDANTNFTFIQYGVSEGAGPAIANLMFVNANTSGFEVNNSSLEIGVAKSTGNATATINGSDIDNFSNVDIGIANGTGAATRRLRNSNGITIPTITAGTNPGGGLSEGRIFVDHGLIRTDVLTLGSGAILELTANRLIRAAGGGSSDVYSAVNTAVATLAGELIFNLQLIPTGSIVFEVINTTSPTGITGLFDTITTNNLPGGFTINPFSWMTAETSNWWLSYKVHLTYHNGLTPALVQQQAMATLLISHKVEMSSIV